MCVGSLEYFIPVCSCDCRYCIYGYLFATLSFFLCPSVCGYHVFKQSCSNFCCVCQATVCLDHGIVQKKGLRAFRNHGGGGGYIYLPADFVSQIFSFEGKDEYCPMPMRFRCLAAFFAICSRIGKNQLRK